MTVENESQYFFWRDPMNPFSGSRKARQEAVDDLARRGLIVDGKLVNGPRLLELPADLVVPGRPKPKKK